MSSSAAAKRLDSLRRLLTDTHARMGLQVGFVLWDGSTVPADLPPDALALTVADEGVVASLIRRPNIDTLANLYASARIDIRNGSIFDLVARRPKAKTRDILRGKTVDRALALKTALSFLFVPRGGPWPLREGIPEDRSSSGTTAAGKDNIHYLYDISNEFHALFLDPEMIYTSAYFHDWSEDLATAQRNKLEMTCRRLRLKPGERMLDIGCGWGGLMCYAVQNYGVTAHGVTLSEYQYAYIQEKIARLGLKDRITVQLIDYTAVQGEFDKISQIEMFEHVGLANHPTFYQTVYRLLKPNGLYLHQANTRPAKRSDKAFNKKRPEVQAMTKYIGPGVELDHIGMCLANFERYGFEVHDVEDWREHQALTCRFWHDRLFANREAAERAGGKVKTRLWLAWTAACAIAFERNTTCVYQTLVSKRRRGPSGLPPTRADLYR